MKTCPKCGEKFEQANSYCPRDGEVLTDDHADMIGRVLDSQYEIEEFIAEGGMGAVYRARHTLLGDRVAIKILPPEMRRNTAWLKRFQREGQAARRFHHPNAVIVHDLRTNADGEVYLVMEFVEGRTLDDEVVARGGHLSPHDAMRIIEPVASVLDAAHAQGVVHRDLKPSNVMITPQGNVKLLDLGLAKLSDAGPEATQLTVTGQLVGTPYYMSPEQWGELPRDGREEIDSRTDIYSLGVMIYKITSGELPFRGDSAVSLRRAHCHQAPRPLEEVAAGVTSAWSRAVLKAMSKDRGDRQATAGEFASELRAALGEFGRETGIHTARTLTLERGATGPEGQRTPQNPNAPTVAFYPAYTGAHQSLPAQSQAPSQATFPAQAKGGSNLTRIILVVLAVLLLAGGGYALLRLRSGARAARRNNSNRPASAPTQTGSEAQTQEEEEVTEEEVSAPVDAAGSADGSFMRYHLLLGETVLDPQRRSTGREPVPAGQTVQFVFKPARAGYIYVLGHDGAGNPVVIPMGETGAGASIQAGVETTLPMLPFIRLDSPSGTESFTVIFTEKPLDEAFAGDTLPLDGSFRKLTEQERRRVESLKQEAAPASLSFEGGAEDSSAVVSLKGDRGNRPVVFDINIKLKRR